LWEGELVGGFKPKQKGTIAGLASATKNSPSQIRLASITKGARIKGLVRTGRRRGACCSDVDKRGGGSGKGATKKKVFLREALLKRSDGLRREVETYHIGQFLGWNKCQAR